MRNLPFLLATATVLSLLVSSSASGAVDPAEWASATAAALEADPTIEPLDPEPGSVTIVGGTRSGVTMAVSARQRLGEASGRMTLVSLVGTLRATVVCIAAFPVEGGGGAAKIVGQLDQPNGTATFLVFRVTDSNASGGYGDLWDEDTSGTMNCAFDPATQPIANGNVVVDPGS
jgi:hypothetical protein